MTPVFRACLTELATNKKQVTSLIKRREHYMIIDNEVIKALACDEIRELLTAIPSKNTDDFTDLIQSLFRGERGCFKSFVTVAIRDILCQNYESEYQLYRKLPSKLEQDVKSIFVEMNTIKTGFVKSKPIYMYDSDGNVASFTHYSGVECGLEEEIQRLPWFYLFSISPDINQTTYFRHPKKVSHSPS